MNDETRGYIIAVDFDGTLVTNAFPEIGEIKDKVWKRLLNAINEGCQVILWTCRNGAHLDAAVQFCSDHGLTFDKVNENLDWIKDEFGGDTRKVFAHEYWDDKVPFENWFMVHGG